MRPFIALSDAALSELDISLSHRLDEAAAGNAYVWVETVWALLAYVRAEQLLRYGARSGVIAWELL